VDGRLHLVHYVNGRSRSLFLGLLLPLCAGAAESPGDSIPTGALTNAPHTFGSGASVGGQFQADDQAKSPTPSPTFIDRYEAWLQAQRSSLRDRLGLTLTVTARRPCLAGISQLANEILPCQGPHAGGHCWCRHWLLRGLVDQ